MGYKTHSGMKWAGSYYVLDVLRFRETPANYKSHVYEVQQIFYNEHSKFPVREGTVKPAPVKTRAEYYETEIYPDEGDEDPGEEEEPSPDMGGEAPTDNVPDMPEECDSNLGGANLTYG